MLDNDEKKLVEEGGDNDESGAGSGADSETEENGKDDSKYKNVKYTNKEKTRERVHKCWEAYYIYLYED